MVTLTPVGPTTSSSTAVELTPPPAGKPGQRTFILVDEHFCTASLRGDLALSENEVLCAKAVDVRLLQLRRRLLSLIFHAHVRTSNS